MKYYNTYKSYTGGYTTVEWSANEMFNYHILIMIVLAYLFSLFSVVAAGLLIFVTLHDAEDEGVKPSIWGALISGVILLDNHFGFILSNLQLLFLGEKIYILTHTLNLTYFATHLFLIFLGPTLYHNTEKQSEKKLFLVLYTLVFGMVFLFFTWGSSIHKPIETTTKVEHVEK